MKKLLETAFILAMACAAVSLRDTAKAVDSVTHSVIRLHVLANSDSLEDQTRKLQVRDALLRHAGDWIPENAGWEQSCTAIQEHLPELEQIARQTLAENGCFDSVRVSFGETEFPERTYGDITLPAGEYQALRVEIGTAEGQNWWCVMYPAMCVPAASAPAPADILPGDAVSLVSEPERYEVRLKCVDAVRAAVRWVRAETKTLIPNRS